MKALHNTTSSTLLTLIAVLGFSAISSAGVPGRVDRAFKSGLASYGLPVHLEQQVSTVQRQPDGKLLVAGALTHSDSTKLSHLFRLNGSGAIDTTFNRGGTGPNGTVLAVTVLGDGKILIGGTFSSYNGRTTGCLARLNANGTLDTTFGVWPSGASDFVSVIMRLPTGRFLIGGQIGSSGVTGLNGDGSPMEEFGGEVNGPVYTAELLRDGNVMIGGAFTYHGGYRRDNIAKIRPDGSLVVPEFFGAALNGAVRAIEELPDGRVMIGGDFTNHIGRGRPYLTCFARDGVPGAMPALAVAGAPVRDILLQRDGRIMVAGVAGVYRLSATGMRDHFIAPHGTENGVSALLQQPDSKVVLAGLFENVDGIPSALVARVDAVQNSSVEFKGIITPSLWNNGMGAALTITLSPDGRFTGRIRVGATNTPITGSFGETLRWTGTIGSGILTSTIDLERTRTETGHDQIYGIVSGDLGDSEVIAAAAYYDATYHPALNARGYYTATLAPDTDRIPAALPHGSSYLTFRIGNGGGLTIGGYLADGTAISYRGRIQAGDWAAFYIPISGGRASLCGVVMFLGRDIDVNVFGTLRWRRPNGVTTTTDNFGALSCDMRIQGSEYDAAVGYGLSPSSVSVSGMIAINYGWLGTESVARGVTIRNNTSLSVPALGPIAEGSPLPIRNLALTADPNTGIISGSCQVPVGGLYRSATIRGVIVQAFNQGIGSVRIPGATAADGARSSSMVLIPRD